MGAVLWARTGETVEVRFPAQPTAGYRWEVEVSPAARRVVALVEEGWDADTTRVGAPAEQRFRFRALAPGTVTVTFRYRRPWEARPPQEIRTVTLHVEGGPLRPEGGPSRPEGGPSRPEGGPSRPEDAP
jgi:predicted secreted protein